MAFTLHSHSGQFCPSHARDTLAAVVEQAAALGFVAVGTSEHMPRLAATDLYPGEAEAELTAFAPRHEAYLAEAAALRERFATRGLEVLIGFESEWIRPGEYVPHMRTLLADPRVDYVVGSVHHVLDVPIDFDAALYARAREAARARHPDLGADGDDSEHALLFEYYASQHEMLRALEPKIVGHLDVIRLLSADERRDPRGLPRVWAQIVANLRLAHELGCILECNSAALRKGLSEPYPGRVIAEEWLRIGGRFSLCDDSHGADQVGACYAGAIAYLEGLGVGDVWRLERVDGEVRERAVSLREVRASLGI